MYIRSRKTPVEKHIPNPRLVVISETCELRFEVSLGFRALNLKPCVLGILELWGILEPLLTQGFQSFIPTRLSHYPLSRNVPHFTGP